MRRIESFRQMMDLSSAVRSRREGLITNFYPDPVKHQVWIDRNAAFFDECGKTVFIAKDNGTFLNVFYISTTIDELRISAPSLKRLGDGRPVVLDIVGRKSQCAQVVEMLAREGFGHAATLVRMQRLATDSDNFPPVEGVSYADLNDVREISGCLHKYFNEMLEQIPYDEELRSLAGNRQILTIRNNGKLSGFLIFEKNASTLYLRYWFTRPEYRDRKVGSGLLRHFFHEGLGTKRQILWVMEDNENAIKRYSHYGFNNEDMHDYIIKYSKDE